MAGRFPSPPERSLTTPLCTLVGVPHPVVQGGMGPPHSSPELVAAVSNAGGLGVLGCGAGGGGGAAAGPMVVGGRGGGRGGGTWGGAGGGRGGGGGGVCWARATTKPVGG